MNRSAKPTTAGHGARATTAEALGRADEQDRRRQRVLTTITTTTHTTSEVSVAAIARAAGVHRSYLYRHPDLLDLIQRASTEQAQRLPEDDVSKTSLMADLAHARARATRAETTTRQLEHRLSGLLGNQVWAATGLAPDHELAAAQRELEATQHQLADALAALEERTQELDAARAANRELMATLNTRSR